MEITLFTLPHSLAMSFSSLLCKSQMRMGVSLFQTRLKSWVYKKKLPTPNRSTTSFFGLGRFSTGFRFQDRFHDRAVRAGVVWTRRGGGSLLDRSNRPVQFSRPSQLSYLSFFSLTFPLQVPQSPSLTRIEVPRRFVYIVGIFFIFRTSLQKLSFHNAFYIRETQFPQYILKFQKHQFMYYVVYIMEQKMSKFVI